MSDGDAKQAQARIIDEPEGERAQVSLEVAFETPAEAVRAYAENVGVGQLALATKEVLPKGTSVTLKVRVPGWAAPLVAVARVTWSRSDAMGLALTHIHPDQQERLRQLVMTNTTRLDRIKRQFTRLAEQPTPAKVGARVTVLVRLEDELLGDAVTELLNDGGVVAISTNVGSKPNLIVAETSTVMPLTDAFHRVPLVMVNVSGHNELALNRMPFIPAKAFVPRPATPARVVQAVSQVLRMRLG